MSASNGTPTYLALGLLRLVYFFGCRRYVHNSLLSDLRQVIHDDAGVTSTASSSSGGGLLGAESSAPPTSPGVDDSGPSSPSKGDGKAGGFPWMGASGSSATKPETLPMMRRTTSGSGNGNGHGSSSSLAVNGHAAAGRKAKGSRWTSSKSYAKGAALVFCWAFCEGSLLFSLVLLGGALDPIARRKSWTLSLGLLIALIVFIAPLAECVLFSLTFFRGASSERPRLLGPRTLILTAVPFGGYLFLFYRVGQTMQDLLGVESGSHSFGFFNTTLARICVPGVFLIASLSGGGAVNTAWETWEWRRRERQAPITDEHISFAEAALQRAQVDLVARQSALEKAKSAEEPAAKGGFLGVFRGGGRSDLTHMEQEVAGLKVMESQMVRDLAMMKRSKLNREYSRTVPGAMLRIVSILFSFYCIYRVCMSCVNLIFGYSKRLPTTRGDSPTSTTPTDIATYVVDRALRSMSVELDVAILSRMLGLALLGTIIMVNMRAVLAWGSRIFKVTSTGLSSSFMLLALAQLMGIYLLTCLISLPSAGRDDSSPSSTDPTDLLSTLPSFQIFTRLFDLVFLLTAFATLAVRWLGKQLSADEGHFGSEFASATAALAKYGRSDADRNIV